MKALCLTQPGQFDFNDLPEPADPAPGQALVRIHRIGICGTDLHAYQGRQTFFTYPRVLGHELAVEVLKTGAGVSNLTPGQFCSVEPFMNCGGCPACRLGKTNCCEFMRTLGVHVDGGMTERILLPAAKLHPSGSLTLDHLAAVEPLCIGAHAWARVEPAASDSVLVIGAGPIGLAVMEAARAALVQPLVMEVSRARLAHAAWMGWKTIDGRAEAEEQIRQALGGSLPRMVFDCTGNPHSMMACFRLVAHGGALVFVGHYPGEITFQNPNFHAREISLYASRNATASDFRRVMGLLESGRIDVKPWLARPVTPEEVSGQFSIWLDPEAGIIKPMIAWPA